MTPRTEVSSMLVTDVVYGIPVGDKFVMLMKNHVTNTKYQVDGRFKCEENEEKCHQHNDVTNITINKKEIHFRGNKT